MACCGKSSCEAALASRAFKLRKRLQNVGFTTFITCTLQGSGDPTLENQRRLTRGIRLLKQFIRRRLRGAGGRPSVWMKECGGSTARLHAHLLWSLPFLPQKELSEAAVSCGLGAIIDIRRTYALNGRGGFRWGIGGYITKYLTKSYGTGLPPRSRRFQTSRVPPYQSAPDWFWHPISERVAFTNSGGICWHPEYPNFLLNSFSYTTTASNRGPPKQLWFDFPSSKFPAQVVDDESGMLTAS